MNAKKTLAANWISKHSWGKVLLSFLTEFQFSFWIYNIWCGIVKYVYALIFCSISNSIAKSSQNWRCWTIFPHLYAKFQNIQFNSFTILLQIDQNTEFIFLAEFIFVHLEEQTLQPFILGLFQTSGMIIVLATLLFPLIKITPEFLFNHETSRRAKHFHHCLYLSQQ